MLNGNSLEVLLKVLPRVLREIRVLRKVLPRVLREIGVLQKVLPRVLFLITPRTGSTFWSTPISRSTLGSTFKSTSRQFPFSTPVAGRPDCDDKQGLTPRFSEKNRLEPFQGFLPGIFGARSGPIRGRAEIVPQGAFWSDWRLFGPTLQSLPVSREAMALQC